MSKKLEVSEEEIEYIIDVNHRIFFTDITKVKLVAEGPAVVKRISDELENRGAVPEAIMERSGTWLAGCDICQIVCPWNEPVTSGKWVNELRKNPLLEMSWTDLVKLNSATFSSLLKPFAMFRMKFAGFQRNLAIAISNADLTDKQKLDLLENISADHEGVRHAVQWAQRRIQTR